MADIESYEYLSEIKKKNKRKITLFLGVIILFFLLSFLPLSFFGITGPLTIDHLINLLLRLSTSAILSFLLGYPLFATDPLATGNSKASQYLKSLYPSRIIEKHYHVSYGAAQKLWFDFFNIWPQSSNYYSQWHTVLERTYNCRFIYYVQRLLGCASIVSGVLLAAIFSYKRLSDNAADFFGTLNPDNIGYFYFAFATVFWYVLKLTNRVPRNQNENPSGCWLKYKEISEIEHSILTIDIFEQASDYKDAVKLIQELRKAQTKDLDNQNNLDT